MLVFLVACAPQEVPEGVKKEARKAQEPETVVQATGPEPAVTVTQQEVQAIPEQETTPSIPEPVMPAELKELLGRADEKVKSYQYLLGEPPDNRLLDTYYVMGDKIKIKLFEYDPYDIDNYFDTVYLDDEAKTAFGFCENKKRCVSKTLDNTKKKWELDYSQYRKKTPYEWLQEIPPTASIVGPQVHESRSATLISYEESGGGVVEMWIDDTYGLPVKIVKSTPAGEKLVWNFNDFTANALKESDVTPKF